MDFKQLMQPHKLEKFAFLWSVVRMFSGFVSLLLGGFPFLQWLLPAATPFTIVRVVGGLLTLMWIISGVAAGYLLYRWIKGGQRVFGAKSPVDTVAFFVLIVSGLHTGLAGLINLNIGLSIVRFYPLLVITALVYLASSAYLLWKWNKSGRRLFGQPVMSPQNQ